MLNTKTFALIGIAIVSLVHVTSAADPGQTMITVAEMHCQGCAKKYAAQLYTVAGVTSVKVDIPNKTLAVVPQPGKTLSPRQLCEAIERTDAQPVRVVSPSVTLLREYADGTRTTGQVQPNRFDIVVAEMHCKGCAQKIAAQLYAVTGVKSVSYTLGRKALIVTSSPGQQLSLWALWEAVENAENRALNISGPGGSLKVAKVAAKQSQAFPAVR